jgi:hypothetical protein
MVKSVVQDLNKYWSRENCLQLLAVKFSFVNQIALWNIAVSRLLVEKLCL